MGKKKAGIRCQHSNVAETSTNPPCHLSLGEKSATGSKVICQPAEPNAPQDGPHNGSEEDYVRLVTNLQNKMHDLLHAREEDKAAWLVEKQGLQHEAQALREQLQERTKLFKDALRSLDERSTEVNRLRQQIEDLLQERFAANEFSQLASDLPQGSTQQGPTGEDYDFLDKQEMVIMIEEMEKKERTQADELTTQAEEIIHLQNEVQEAAVTLEKRETELNKLRMQLQMLEKADREKKEEHSNLVASMTAVEEIWENENARAAQLKEVLSLEIQRLQNLLVEREKDWGWRWQCLVQEAGHREELCRVLIQEREREKDRNWSRERERGKLVASWLSSPDSMGNPSPCTSPDKCTDFFPSSLSTRTKSVMFDDDFLIGMLEISKSGNFDDEQRMASMSKALNSSTEDDTLDRGNFVGISYLSPLPLSPDRLSDDAVSAISSDVLPTPFQQFNAREGFLAIDTSAGAGENQDISRRNGTHTRARTCAAQGDTGKQESPGTSLYSGDGISDLGSTHSTWSRPPAPIGASLLHFTASPWSSRKNFSDLFTRNPRNPHSPSGLGLTHLSSPIILCSDYDAKSFSSSTFCSEIKFGNSGGGQDPLLVPSLPSSPLPHARITVNSDQIDTSSGSIIGFSNARKWYY